MRDCPGTPGWRSRQNLAALSAGLRAAPVIDDPDLPVGIEFRRGVLEEISIATSGTPFAVWTSRLDFGIVDRFVAATPSDSRRRGPLPPAGPCRRPWPMSRSARARPFALSDRVRAIAEEAGKMPGTYASIHVCPPVTAAQVGLYLRDKGVSRHARLVLAREIVDLATGLAAAGILDRDNFDEMRLDLAGEGLDRIVLCSVGPVFGLWLRGEPFEGVDFLARLRVTWQNPARARPERR